MDPARSLQSLDRAILKKKEKKTVCLSIFDYLPGNENLREQSNTY